MIETTLNYLFLFFSKSSSDVAFMESIDIDIIANNATALINDIELLI